MLRALRTGFAISRQAVAAKQSSWFSTTAPAFTNYIDRQQPHFGWMGDDDVPEYKLTDPGAVDGHWEQNMGRVRNDLPFTMDEYYARLVAVRKLMEKEGVENLMVTLPENIFYLTGMTTCGNPAVHSLIVPMEGTPYMVTRMLELSNVDFRTWIAPSGQIGYHDVDDPYQVLSRALIQKKHHKSIMGVEMRGCKGYLLETMQERLPSMTFVDCSSLIGSLRLAKSPAELKKIEGAAEMTVGGIEAMIEATKNGNTENVIAAEGYHRLFSMGSTYAGYPIFVSSGPHGALGHSTSHVRQVQEGDLVFLELTGVNDRYAAPIMRTVYIGDELPPWLEILSNAVDRAVTEAMENMKPGVPANTVDRITRVILGDAFAQVESEHGFKCTQLARSAYSVGINFMIDWGEGEFFSFSPAEHRELVENMVFHLIPWVQIWNPDGSPVGGIGLSETVIVTPSGGKSIFEPYMKQGRIERRVLPVGTF